MNPLRPVPILSSLFLVLALAACSDDHGDRGGEASTAIASQGSDGCTVSPPAAGRTEVTMTSGGRERTYIRYVPQEMLPGKAVPLVLDLTAYSPASTEESFSGFTKPDAAGRVKADDVGAVVITPEPVNGAGPLLTWNYVDKPGWTDDQLFVSDLLDDVEAAACIDTDRVLVMGFAVGGVFGSILACDQTDRFAALVTVSGLYSPTSCSPSKPLPVLSFHGTADRFIPFDGGVGSGAGELGLTEETTAGMLFMGRRDGALQSSQAWADHDGCTVGPIDSSVTDGVTRKAWSGCTNGTVVELYVIDGGEHTWPGSNGMDALTGLLGPVTDAVVANDVIWDFFEAHTR
jgi:polyhydroxybutyrate depolymerase